MFSKAPKGSYLVRLGRDIGRLLLIPTAMSGLSIFVALLAQDWIEVIAFAVTCGLLLAVSLLLQRVGQQLQDSSMAQTLISVALGWGLIAATGALPLWLSVVLPGGETAPTVSHFGNPLNALFEGFSGFTSAGLTMAIQESQLPSSLQWWRSLMQWVGGVGVIVFAIALLDTDQNNADLYQAEGRQMRLRLTISQTVQRILVIYTAYTLFGTFLFRLVGMPWWAALNHSMTAISTGGFSVTDNSIGAYGSAVKVAVIIMMILGALTFKGHDQVFRQRRLAPLWRDHQHRLLLVLLILGTVLIAVENYIALGSFAWLDSAFQWVSSLTTCGFSSESVQFWSDSNKLLLSGAMIIGGAAGSTVGGLKLQRVLVLIKATFWRLQRTTLSPRQMMYCKVNGQLLAPEQARRQMENAIALAILWIGVIFLATLALNKLIPFEYTLSDTIFEVSSALGAAGLSAGISGPSLHWGGKVLLMLLMWMGRLEIIPVVMLLAAPWGYLIRRLEER